jgi:hypothetical protein
MALDRKRARELAKKSAAVRKRKAEERRQSKRRKQQAARLHRQSMTIIDALSLWPEFDAPSWDAWKAFLKALFGLPLSESDLETFARHTGRTALLDLSAYPDPTGHTLDEETDERDALHVKQEINGVHQNSYRTDHNGETKVFSHGANIRAGATGFNEAWVVVGRRGGKSRIAALVAVYLALFRDYADTLSPGERGVVMCLAADRRQARQVFGYVRGLIESVPMLAELVDVERKESIDFKNGVTIEVHTASYRTVRGYTVVGAVCDEIAFWRDESSANPDREVLDALRPSMATITGSVLLSISTPYARRGELWRAYQQHYGKDTPVLVWRAGTREMNPNVPESVIETAYERDSVAASAEYGAEFRRDVEAFLSSEAITAVSVSNRIELPRVEGVRYHAFVDPSGGSQDSFTLAVAHRENDVGVLDCVRERKPPFKPDEVVKEFASVLRSYGVIRITGDRYSGQWVRDSFQKCGITYVVSKHTKSDIYGEILAPINSGMVELLDLPKLRAQSEGLERRTARGGRDSIDHAPGGHYDIANSCAGALLLALENRRAGPTAGLTACGL